MEKSEYESLLKQARRSYTRHRTKELAARMAAGDTIVGRRDLSRDERRELRDQLAQDILSGPKK